MCIKHAIQFFYLINYSNKNLNSQMCDLTLLLLKRFREILHPSIDSALQGQIPGTSGNQMVPGHTGTRGLEGKKRGSNLWEHIQESYRSYPADNPSSSFMPCSIHSVDGFIFYVKT